MTSRTGLKRRVEGNDSIIVAPGAYDCITARLIEQSGFEAVYMTGAGSSASFGFPDYGLLTMSEMAENAGRIAAAVDIPLIADGDTGYGNELNVTRTVVEYERKGISAIHIEDQEFPKRCGHLDEKVVIAADDYVAKIRAAVAARTSSDFVIIARTDARASLGFEEAIRRANRSLEAGADMAFVEAPHTLDEIAAVPKQVNGPCLLNLVWAGKTPLISFEDAGKFGYRIVILPGMLLSGVISTCESILSKTKKSGCHAPMENDMTVADIFRRMGSEEWDTIRNKYKEIVAAE